MAKMSEQKEIDVVAIAMATFNGGLYLKGQVRSIIGQGYMHWRLYVRDDVSTDDTAMQVNGFADDDERITVVPSSKNLGVLGNFDTLLREAQSNNANYVFLSDQDDVWSEDKIESELKLIKEMEARCGEEVPLLIHSDLEVVDQNLGLLDKSFMKYQGVFHEDNDPLAVLLVQNFVTGCTVLINKKLLDIALPFPEEALMHDWWLALCATVFGQIGYIDEPLVEYRQHGDNQVGAKHIGYFINLISGRWKKRWMEGRDNLFQSMRQAEVLADRIREHDPGNAHLSLVEEYSSLYRLSPESRIKRLKQLGVHAQSNARQVLLLSRLLLTPKGEHV